MSFFVRGRHPWFSPVDVRKAFRIKAGMALSTPQGQTLSGTVYPYPNLALAALCRLLISLGLLDIFCIGSVKIVLSDSEPPEYWKSSSYTSCLSYSSYGCTSMSDWRKTFNLNLKKNKSPSSERSGLHSKVILNVRIISTTNKLIFSDFRVHRLPLVPGDDNCASELAPNSQSEHKPRERDHTAWILRHAQLHGQKPPRENGGWSACSSIF